MLQDSYKAFFAKNKITLDDSQNRLLGKFLNLNKILLEYKKKRKKKIIRLFTKPKVPKGMYVYGSVGCGKTMMCKLFFDNICIEKKKYYHFQSFMLQVHQLLKEYREKHGEQDYVQKVAEYFAQNYRFVYIDELEINDIADAMIVGKLFRELFRLNIMLLITSNRHPNDLYKNGLQREVFLEFINIVTEKLDIFSMNSDCDYRKLKTKNLNESYFYPINASNSKKLTSIFHSMVEKELVHDLQIIVNDRKILCNHAYKKVCWFEYDELFKLPMAAVDYLAICREFDYIFVHNIPIFSIEENNEARRFIIFIDTIYENKKILLLTADADPYNLCKAGKVSFEFERVTSRLLEMQSKEWLSKI